MDRNAYTDLMENIEENFEDIEDSILADLENDNEEYQALLEESSEADARYPFIWQALYGEGELKLTEKEHAILFEYLMTENEIHNIERRAIYLRGYTDASCPAAKDK